MSSNTDWDLLRFFNFDPKLILIKRLYLIKKEAKLNIVEPEWNNIDELEWHNKKAKKKLWFYFDHRACPIMGFSQNKQYPAQSPIFDEVENPSNDKILELMCWLIENEG